MRDLGQFAQRRPFREADEPEVRLVHPQQQCGPFAHCTLVVVGARAVRRSDLDEPCTRALEHVRDAKAVADLDQLATRDEHLASFGERGDGEQERGGVVVDDKGSLCAGQPAEERRDVILARAPRTGARSSSRLE